MEKFKHLNQMLSCYGASNEFCFLAFFSFFVLIDMDYLSGLKNKSVLSLKNFSFVIKSMAPSNIKCLKNVLNRSIWFSHCFLHSFKKKLRLF